MADEITISATMNATNSNYTYSKSLTATVDQTTASGGAPGVQNIGTTHEQLIGLADLAAEGYAIAKNLDTSNYVEIGVDVSATFYPLLKLKPGEFSLFRLSPGRAGSGAPAGCRSTV